MKYYKIQTRSQKNSQSCLPLNKPPDDICLDIDRGIGRHIVLISFCLRGNFVPYLRSELVRGGKDDVAITQRLKKTPAKGTVLGGGQNLDCINRTLRINCIAGKCYLPSPKGHHHESIINVFSGFSTF